MTPFTIEIPDTLLVDLHQRIDATRLPAAVEGVGWQRGMPPALLAEWLKRWRGFDWRKAEHRLNGFANFIADVDGTRLHFVHARAETDDAIPLLLMNGWPSTFAELLPLAERLARPTAGGRAFHIIIPSLPGFGFSPATTEPGWGPTRIAAAMAKLMGQLGYERFGIHGSDIGAAVMRAMVGLVPERLIGLHSANVLGAFGKADNLTDEEASFLEKSEEWQRAEGAYNKIQATKPHTLAASLSDSPAGMAAWALEKWESWSDGGLDAYNPEDVLTMLTIFWITNSLASSIHVYAEMGGDPTMSKLGKTDVPTGVLIMPKDISHAPRSWGERWFNLVRWTEARHGGHFPALETTDVLASEIQATFDAILQADSGASDSRTRASQPDDELHASRPSNRDRRRREN